MVASKHLNLDKKLLYKILSKNILKNKMFDKASFVEPGFLNLNFSTFWLGFLKTIYLEKIIMVL